MSSPDFLPPLHPPGRSGTKSAWEALIALFLVVVVAIFHPFLLRTSVRSILWITHPITGLTVISQKMEVTWGRPLRWHNVIISSGRAPHESHLAFKDLSLGLASPWRIFAGDHKLITSLQASEGKGVVDLRNEASANASVFFKQLLQPLHIRYKAAFIPDELSLHDISLVLLTQGECYSVDNLSCSLPQKATGSLSYSSIFIEAGAVSCHLPKGNCEAAWDGKMMVLHNWALADEINLLSLRITPHVSRIELGLIAKVFQGILRADGSLSNNPSGLIFDGAMLGQRLSLDRLSKFLGLKKNISGNLREGRIIFRGSALHLCDAEASLRMIADNVRWQKRGWAALVVTANLIGRKISVTDFQLKQHDNRVVGSGEMTLPEEWRKIAQAPFVLKLKATITDASQLVDLIGSPWNKITGKLFMEGEVHGAANHADGYFNTQGTAMTAYGLPINSLKLQLLFQGEKTNIANMDLWSGQDRLQFSGIVENSWPHHYEEKGSLHSDSLSEKLMPLLEQLATELPEELADFSWFQNFCKNMIAVKWHDSTFAASWDTHGTALHHEGSFNVALDEFNEGSFRLNHASIGGDADLLLQGDGNERLLHGNVMLHDITGSPKLVVTPFLIPPGIIIPRVASTDTDMAVNSTSKSPKTSCDIAIKLPAAVATESPFGAIDLHLTGRVLSPTLDGTIDLHHLPLLFPQTTMLPLSGGWVFHADQPWIPELQLTVAGILYGKKITAFLSDANNNPTLHLQRELLNSSVETSGMGLRSKTDANCFVDDSTKPLQSDSSIAPEELALLLASSEETSHQEAEGWMSELPYWVRQQEFLEPTTLKAPLFSLDATLREDLGFTGCGVAYHAELR